MRRFDMREKQAKDSGFRHVSCAKNGIFGRDVSIKQRYAGFRIALAS